LRENQEEVVSPEAMKFIRHPAKNRTEHNFLDKRFKYNFKLSAILQKKYEMTSSWHELNCQTDRGKEL